MKSSIMLGFTLLAVVVNPQAGEVLQSISDDSAVPTTAATVGKRDGDHIVYRVSCQADGEVLPDCERSFDDHEPLLPMPDLPQDAEDISEASSPESAIVPAAATATVPSKVTAAKASTRKKSAKVSQKVTKTKTHTPSSTSKAKVSSKDTKAKKSPAKRKTHS